MDHITARAMTETDTGQMHKNKRLVKFMSCAKTKCTRLRLKNKSWLTDEGSAQITKLEVLKLNAQGDLFEVSMGVVASSLGVVMPVAGVIAVRWRVTSMSPPSPVELSLMNPLHPELYMQPGSDPLLHLWGTGSALILSVRQAQYMFELSQTPPSTQKTSPQFASDGGSVCIFARPR